MNIKNPWREEAVKQEFVLPDSLLNYKAVKPSIETKCPFKALILSFSSDVTHTITS